MPMDLPARGGSVGVAAVAVERLARGLAAANAANPPLLLMNSRRCIFIGIRFQRAGSATPAAQAVRRRNIFQLSWLVITTPPMPLSASTSLLIQPASDDDVAR